MESDKQMNIFLTSDELHKLVPHIQIFEFYVSIAKVGLEYITSSAKTVSMDNKYTIKEMAHEFKIVDEQKFFLAKIKHGV
jgi:hypothetical protein